jgi:hypothetical protein
MKELKVKEKKGQKNQKLLYKKRNPKEKLPLELLQ